MAYWTPPGTAVLAVLLAFPAATDCLNTSVAHAAAARVRARAAASFLIGLFSWSEADAHAGAGHALSWCPLAESEDREPALRPVAGLDSDEGAVARARASGG